MLRSTVSLPEIPLKFPSLYRAKNNRCVVLFWSETSGTVLVQGNGNYDVGFVDKSWVPCTNWATWELLPPGTSVTVTVE